MNYVHQVNKLASVMDRIDLGQGISTINSGARFRREYTVVFRSIDAIGAHIRVLSLMDIYGGCL